MSELTVPLLLMLLVALAVLARGFVQASIATPLAWIAGLSVVAYGVVELGPRATSAVLGPLRVELQPPQAFGVLGNGQPTAIDVQIYRGPLLVQEQKIEPSPAATASDVELRLEPIEGRDAFRVLRGEIALGEVTADSLDQARADALVSSAAPGGVYDEAVAFQPDPPLVGRRQTDAEVGIDSGAPDESTPAATDPALPSVASGPAEKGAVSSAKPLAKATASRPRRARAPEARDPDRSEVELRARASLLAVDSVCSAADLLRGGQDPRTRALEREFSERCSRAR